jgi:hypothetical protein
MSDALPPPTPFCRAVVAAIAAHGGASVDAATLRCDLLRAGHGRSPSAMARHLAVLSWKNTYVSSYVGSDDRRHFLLTSDGAELAESTHRAEATHGHV